MSEFHKLLPNDPSAERGILSAFLLMPPEVGNICAEMRLAPEDFYAPAHAVMFRHLLVLWGENTGIDAIVLTESLRKGGELQDAGGAPYVSEVSTFIFTVSLVRPHIEIVREKSMQRQMHSVCTRFAGMAHTGDTEAVELLLAAHNAIADIGARKASQGRTFKTILMDTLDSIERGDDATADILSGIYKLDEVVRMRRGNLIVIGGEAKSGKTALAGTILTHAAVLQEQRCAVFSLEMTDVEITKRALSCMGRVNIAMMGRKPTEDEIARLTRGAHALMPADVEIVSDVFDLGGIVAKSRQFHAKRPLALIVLDYIQLVEHTTGRKGETRQEIVAQISRTCKRLSGELNCVVIALSQLNDDGKLRESRAIGQDANAIIQVEVDSSGGRSLRVVAQRNGASGETIPVRWLPQFSRFEDAI